VHARWFADGKRSLQLLAATAAACSAIAPIGSVEGLDAASAKAGVSPATGIDGGDAATVRRGLASALASGRLAPSSAAQHSATLARAAAAIGRLSTPRAAILSAVLHDVAVHASAYNEPRAIALFGMLEANRAHLARPHSRVDARDIVDGAGVVYRTYPGHGFQFQALASFARLNALVSGGREASADRLALALVERGITGRGSLYWEYYFPFHGPPRWTSGFVQAVAAQALARAGELLGDEALAHAAYQSFRAMLQTHVRPLAGGLWIREYGFSDIAILNAQLQSLVSLTSFAAIANTSGARRAVTQLDQATRALLGEFDTGCWSLYSLGGARASPHYHEYHVQLLRRLAANRSHAIWRETVGRWSHTASPCRSG
jgi:hypothetical protein